MTPANAVRNPRCLRWPLIVIGLLLGHVCLMAVAVTVAVRDRSNPVVPDYYQKAADWDRTHAAPPPRDRSRP